MQQQPPQHNPPPTHLPQPSANPADNDIHISEPLCAVFRSALRTQNLKYTPERAQILDTIVLLDDVFQADQLLEALKQKGFRVSKATVYRTIKLLDEAGIIQPVLFDDAEQTHYQLAYGSKSSGLLVNLDTKQTTTIELPELIAIRDRVCKDAGVKPDGHRFVIYARSK